MSSKIFDKLRRTRKAKSLMIEGEEFWACSLNMGDLARLDAISKTEPEELAANRRLGLIAGLSLCEDADGTQALPRNDGETDEVWADRIYADLREGVPIETLRTINEFVAGLSRTSKPDAIAKN